MIKSQLFIGAALVVGVAVGYFLRDDDRLAEAPSAGTKSATMTKVVDKGMEASLSALRARIAELERQLAESARVQEDAVSNAVATIVAKRTSRRFDPRERMEELKRSDPARYVQVTNSMAQWRKQRAERQQTRMEFLSSVDTSRMSASAQKTHAELQDLMAQREALMERLQDENLTHEQRHEIWNELRASGDRLRQVNAAERANLLNETARALGFEGENVEEITRTVLDVIEATDGENGWGGPPRGPGGPRGFGGAGGPLPRR